MSLSAGGYNHVPALKNHWCMGSLAYLLLTLVQSAIDPIVSKAVTQHMAEGNHHCESACSTATDKLWCRSHEEAQFVLCLNVE